MNYSRPFLGKIVNAEIDRKLGSMHPKYDFVYPINYGFVPGTKAPDGAGLDVYVLGVDTAVEEFEGRCIAIIHRTNDDDDKLVLCGDGESYSDEEIREYTNFQEQWFESVIIRN